MDIAGQLLESPLSKTICPRALSSHPLNKSLIKLILFVKSYLFPNLSTKVVPLL